LRKILHAAFLAPDIVDAVLDGQHPVGLTMEKLRKRPPVDWQEQRTRLGFTLPAGIAEKKNFHE
jgi:site-specific DNA recombinase